MNILYTDEVSSGIEREFFIKVAEAVFAFLGLSDNNYEISLLVTDDMSIREYNKAYRGKDSATDVLSFPMNEDIMLGDIAISFDTAKWQAADNGINIDRETAFLFIHGLLHLLGYDHERSEKDEKEMFEMQESILKKLIDCKAVS